VPEKQWERQELEGFLMGGWQAKGWKRERDEANNKGFWMEIFFGYTKPG
jgi:hypothetical protein